VRPIILYLMLINLVNYNTISIVILNSCSGQIMYIFINPKSAVFTVYLTIYISLTLTNEPLIFSLALFGRSWLFTTALCAEKYKTRFFISYFPQCYFFFDVAARLLIEIELKRNIFTKPPAP
jgi:hypothetical protein